MELGSSAVFLEAEPEIESELFRLKTENLCAELNYDSSPPFQDDHRKSELANGHVSPRNSLPRNPSDEGLIDQ